MKRVVVAHSGSQMSLAEKETVLVNNTGLKAGDKIKFDQVLLYQDGDKVVLGHPQVTDCEVVGKVIDNLKGEKIKILKFKAKSRYHKRRGYRSQYSKVIIEKINYGKN